MTQAQGTRLPKISIVMPSYNQGEYLRAAIESVLGQDYPDIELLVVDGGSTDESIYILQEYDAHIARWVSEKDKGQSDALNKGFSWVTGDIVGWLNSDDTYEPGSFNEVAEAFANTEDKIVMCSSFGLMQGDGEVYDFKANSYVDHKTLIRFWTTGGMTINQPSVFMRSDLLSEFSPLLDAGLEYAMDYDLWLRITQTYPIRVIEGCWANYRFHDTSKSGTGFDKFFEEWFAVSRRYWGPEYSRAWVNHRVSQLYYHFVRRPIGAVRRLFRG